MEAAMKAKIEVVANVLVILLAVVIGSVYLRDRLSVHGSAPNEVKAGDRLPRLAGWDWSAHDRSLVLVLKKGCHFCEDSAPFYQRLAAHQRAEAKDVAIVAVFPDNPDAVREAVQTDGLVVHVLPGVPLEILKVSATPSVLLVDKSGTVLNAWIGMLSPKQELEVMRALACPSNTCRERA
jgi:hypothetical protein